MYNNLTNHQLVFDWMSKFGQETPTELIMPDLETRRLRASLIFEEALECVAALGFCVKATRTGYENTYVFLSPDLTTFKFVDEAEPSMSGILDGLVDLDWMNKGTLVSMGISAEMLKELEQEVYRSNCSKLWTEEEVAENFGVDFDGTPGEKGSNIKGDNFLKVSDLDIRCYLVKSHPGKVLKSPSYLPARLAPIITHYAYNNPSNNLESTKL